MNRIVLVGRLVKDPELTYTPNGVPVAKFTLAVNRPFAKEDQQKADFVPCIIWRKPAENVANFLKKGSMAGVDGRIQTRNFEGQDGKRVYVTEVLCESVQFLESKQQNGQNQGQNQQPNTNTSQGQQNQYRGIDPYAGNGQIDISDDDLPF